MDCSKCLIVFFDFFYGTTQQIGYFLRCLAPVFLKKNNLSVPFLSSDLFPDSDTFLPSDSDSFLPSDSDTFLPTDSNTFLSSDSDSFLSSDEYPFFLGVTQLACAVMKILLALERQFPEFLVRTQLADQSSPNLCVNCFRHNMQEAA